MKALVVIAVGATLVAGVSACDSSPRAASSRTVAAQQRLPAEPPRVVTLYGHIKSLTHKGRRFELRVDPALWLGGLTAERAQLEDTGSGDVSNDHYIRDEGHLLLTYRVPADARVSVVTVPQGRISGASVTVAELAQLVKGKNPRHRPLFAWRYLGFWIRVVGQDTVRSLDQQYQP